MSNIITLTTDFGLKDHYVGTMKGAILSINPKAKLIDVTHNVPAFNVEEGAYLIGSSFFTFPKGTIHIVVVDPGVGSVRRPILVCTDHYYFIAPDNGVLSLVAERDNVKAIYHLDKPKFYLDQLSATFHGRDIFGPIAAYLAKGKSPQKLGTPIKDFNKLDLFTTTQTKDYISAKVIHIDHFGNVTLGFAFEKYRDLIVNKPFEIRVKDSVFSTLRETYFDVPQGSPLLLVGSSGFLEVAIHQDSFAMINDIQVGERVELGV